MKNLNEFLNESLVNEASNVDINAALKTIGRISNEDEYLVSQCYDWLEKTGWEKREEDELFDLIKNLDKKGLDKRTLDLIKELNKPSFDKRSFDNNYFRCMNAMATAGKSNVDKFLSDIGHW